jgi:hypothetical protein
MKLSTQILMIIALAWLEKLQLLRKEQIKITR